MSKQIQIGNRYRLQKLKSRSEQYEGREVVVTGAAEAYGPNFFCATLADGELDEFGGFVLSVNQLGKI